MQSIENEMVHSQYHRYKLSYPIYRNTHIDINLFVNTQQKKNVCHSRARNHLFTKNQKNAKQQKQYLISHSTTKRSTARQITNRKKRNKNVEMGKITPNKKLNCKYEA